MEIRYPWKKIQPGEGFFVPGLDVQKIRERGLMAALPYRINAKAVIGIKEKKIGVWFYRPRLGSS